MQSVSSSAECNIVNFLSHNTVLANGKIKISIAFCSVFAPISIHFCSSSLFRRNIKAIPGLEEWVEAREQKLQLMFDWLRNAGKLLNVWWKILEWECKAFGIVEPRFNIVSSPRNLHKNHTRTHLSPVPLQWRTNRFWLCLCFAWSFPGMFRIFHQKNFLTFHLLIAWRLATVVIDT